MCPVPLGGDLQDTAARTTVECKSCCSDIYRRRREGVLDVPSAPRRRELRCLRACNSRKYGPSKYCSDITIVGVKGVLNVPSAPRRRYLRRLRACDGRKYGPLKYYSNIYYRRYKEGLDVNRVRCYRYLSRLGDCDSSLYLPLATIVCAKVSRLSTVKGADGILTSFVYTTVESEYCSNITIVGAKVL